MQPVRVKVRFIQAVVLLSLLVLMGAQDTTNHTTAPVVPISTINGTSGESGSKTSNLLKSLNVDPSMIRRAMYVLIGITGVGVLYFLVRAVRMKKPHYKKKYGLLANMELDGMESDEDETLYEARSLRR